MTARRAGRPRPYGEVGEGCKDIHRMEKVMAESGPKLILTGKLADGLGGVGKADGSTTRCLGMFKA